MIQWKASVAHTDSQIKIRCSLSQFKIEKKSYGWRQENGKWQATEDGLPYGRKTSIREHIILRFTNSEESVWKLHASEGGGEDDETEEYNGCQNSSQRIWWMRMKSVTTNKWLKRLSASYGKVNCRKVPVYNTV